MKIINEYTITILSNSSNVPTNSNYNNKIYRQMVIITLKENYLKLWIGIFWDKLSDTKKQLIDISKGIIAIIKNNDCLIKESVSDFLITLMEQGPW